VKKIRVLIVEDSAFMRKALKNILEADAEIEVIGLARDGEDGIRKARELRPDVVTMDINLPGIDGITALQVIVSENICPVIMVSSLTQEGALITFEALELGAFDFIAKPGGTVSMNIHRVEAEIIEKVKAATRGGSLQRIRNRQKRSPSERYQVSKTKKREWGGRTDAVKTAIAIGVSTGGPKTLMDILIELPADLDAAIFIVQHMPPNFTSSFAKRLNQYVKFSIKEAESCDPVQNSCGYLAKGGFHLLLREKNSGEKQIRLSTLPTHLFIPSVGVMMESVLQQYGHRTVGVLMTGMGDDGADAMVKIKQAGGITIAESEETAVVFGMPKEAIDRGGVDIVAPNYKIAGEIVRNVEKLNRHG